MLRPYRFMEALYLKLIIAQAIIRNDLIAIT